MMGVADRGWCRKLNLKTSFLLFFILSLTRLRLPPVAFSPPPGQSVRATLSAQSKVLLHDVVGVATPGRMLALMVRAPPPAPAGHPQGTRGAPAWHPGDPPPAIVCLCVQIRRLANQPASQPATCHRHSAASLTASLPDHDLDSPPSLWLVRPIRL